MSGNSSQAAGATTSTPSNPFLDFWAEYMNRSGAQSKALLEGIQAASDPQKLQQRFLEALAESFDTFMRSPAYLEALRQNLKVMTDMKKLQDQAVEDVARHVGAPLASDIHGLFERLNSAEQTIISRLQAIEGRLEAIESKRRGGGSSS